MTPFYLNVKKLPGAKFEMGREEDAGYDLYSMIDLVLWPGKSALIPAGIMTEFPSDWVGLIQNRSSMGMKGVMRQGGVIDSNYRGEWGVKLYNAGEAEVRIESVITNPNAKAIAQVVFNLRGKAPINYVETLSESARGQNWNGSTNAHNQPQKG